MGLSFCRLNVREAACAAKIVCLIGRLLELLLLRDFMK